MCPPSLGPCSTCSGHSTQEVTAAVSSSMDLTLAWACCSQCTGSSLPFPVALLLTVLLELGNPAETGLAASLRHLCASQPQLSVCENVCMCKLAAASQEIGPRGLVLVLQ